LSRWGQDIKGSSYRYETANFGYYVQEFLGPRRLLIIDLNTQETIKDIVFYPNESFSNAALNNQWTGKLFKDKPPVIFGLEWVSFGCPGITFLDRFVQDIGINCDNRH
jgi:hypothetical protein